MVWKTVSLLSVREIRKFTDSQLPWKKGALRGRDRTRRIAFEFGQKLADLKLSSRVEDHDRSLAELFSFSSKCSLQARWTVPVQWQKALPAISETKWQGECVVHWKLEEAFKLSESARQDVEEESMVIERRWKWPSFYALIVLSWRAQGYRTKAKMLLVVETQHRSLNTFCNDREWGGRGMDVFTFRTWVRLLWENNS